MKLDKKALDRLLTLNDENLKKMIEAIAAESGLDLSSFGISAGDIASVRAALSGATDEDLKKAAEQIEEFKRGGML